MNMVFVRWWLWCLLFSSTTANTYCPNDEDLQRHRCSCSITNAYIQCSTLPTQCRTCHLYTSLFFDEHVTELPAEAFRFYDFFHYTSNTSFIIQFAQLNSLSSNTFSKINIEHDRTLAIKILKYTSPILPTRTFEEITLQQRAKVDVEIFDVTSMVFDIEQYAFDGIQHNFESEFRLIILNAKETIQFQSNAGSIMLPAHARMKLIFSNFVHVIVAEHSFDHMTLERSSEFKLNFDRFQQATLEHAAFFDMHQLDGARFHLSLANFQRLNIEQTLFDTVTQLKSSLILSIYNMSNDLCLPARTFSQIKQDINSTFQLQITYGRNILFTPYTFVNITQTTQSSLSIFISNSFDVYFARRALEYIHQDNRCLLDIWIKYSQNLIFEDDAIRNVDIWRSSIMRIGFQHSHGTLQLATNAFANINEGQGGELLFQILNASDFYLRFNQTASLQRLELVDRSLSSSDLCRIVDIPSHIPVKLLPETICSCPIFYLYRHLRRTLNPLRLRDLTPSCYINMSLEEIERAEKQCTFDQTSHNCQQMQGQLRIDIPPGSCVSNAKLNNNDHRPSPSKSSTSPILLVLLVIGCFIFGIICVHIVMTRKKCSPLNFLEQFWRQHRRQKLPIFSADSYQQLTHGGVSIEEEEIDMQRALPNQRMKIIVKYNSTTEQTRPYLNNNNNIQSDFIVSNEDVTLKLNTNPLSDMKDS